MAGWGEGGAGWGSIPFTYIPISGGGSLHLPRVATLSPSHPSLTGYFFEAFGSVDQPEKFFGPQGSSWIFGIFRLSHWRHSWVPLKGSLREDSCFFLSGSGLSLRPHSLMGHSVGALRSCSALQRKFLSWPEENLFQGRSKLNPICLGMVLFILRFISRSDWTVNET